MALETGAFMQASSYSAEIVRRAMFAQYARTSANNPGIISGGLIGATDFQISQVSSPNMTVNVSTGEAIVPGNEGGAQGGYYVRGTSTSNLPISTADATNPRIDTVCLTCGDAQYTLPSGGTSGSLTLQVVTGTPTAGASLSNLSGAASLPGSSLLLGYVLVPASATSVSSIDIANKATPVLLGGASTISGAITQPSRSLGSAYQPNTVRSTLVAVTATGSTGSGIASVTANIGATSSPATAVIAATGAQNGTYTIALPLTFLVPVGWYYEIVNGANISAITVTETVL